MNEEEIIKRVLQGEKALFEILVKKYFNRAYAKAFSLLLNREDAEDIAQESFISAYVSLATLRDHRKFAQWVSGIVNRKSIYFLRKKVKKNEFFEGIYQENATHTVQHSSENPEERDSADEKRRVVLHELSCLPVKYREVIYMRYFKGCTYQEIADFMGLTKSGVDTRIQRARSLFQQRLKKKGIADEM